MPAGEWAGSGASFCCRKAQSGKRVYQGMSDTGINEARKIAEESEYGARKLRPGLETNLVNLIAFSWVIFSAVASRCASS